MLGSTGQRPDAADGGGSGINLLDLMARQGGSGNGKPVSPNEDVREYLQATLLPSLGPAIEKLLRHVHETGELQRALTKLDSDGRPKPPPQPSTEKSADAAVHGKKGTEHSPEKKGHDSSGPATPQVRPDSGSEKNHGKVPAVALEKAAAAGEGPQTSKSDDSGFSTENVENAFDPLIWLSEYLQQFATTPPEQYREQIQGRIVELRKIRDEEEAARLAAEAEAAEKARIEAEAAAAEAEAAEKAKADAEGANPQS